jgi:lipopolysaccharide biosynthesis glycosyltransferase
MVLSNSLIKSNPDVLFNVYIISKDLNSEDVDCLKKNVNQEVISYHLINFDDSLLAGSPTSSRYPLEIYYRIFAAKVLPIGVDKILYLDPDTVVINKLDELYNLDFKDNYFIGATHIRKALNRFNRLRVNQKKKVPYINTGVMMLNIKLLRDEQKVEDVYKFINKYKLMLSLPDQDVIFGLYGHKVLLVDFLVYNLSDRTLKKHNKITKSKLDELWVRDNTVVVHYCGRNKPWKPNYKGILDVFYNEIEVKK